MDGLFEGNDKQKSISRAKPAKPRTPKQQANDEIWDTLAAEFFPSGVGPDDKTRLGKVVRNLKAKNATPEEIRRRIQNFPHVFRNCDGGCTLEGLNRQWDKLATSKPHVPGRNPKLAEREAHEEAVQRARLKQEAKDRADAMEWYQANKDSDPEIPKIRQQVVSAANTFQREFYKKNLATLALHVRREWLKQ